MYLGGGQIRTGRMHGGERYEWGLKSGGLEAAGPQSLKKEP